MKKIGSVLYNKLLLQAQEAKDQGLTVLSERILEAIGPQPDDSVQTYSHVELKEDIHRDLWKIASKLFVFYDLASVDAQSVDRDIIRWTAKTLDELERTLGVDKIVKGSNEPDLPGETK